MEERNARLGRGDAPSQGELPQDVHEAGDLNLVRASGGTGLARRAQPDAVALQEFVLLAVGGKPDDLHDTQVKKLADGTA